MQSIKDLKRHFMSREFLLFLVVGCINTFNVIFLSWLYAFIVGDHNIAFNFGYISCNIIAYFLNSEFIFHEPLSLKRCVKFFLSYLPNYFIQNLVVIVFYNLLGYPPVVSYIIAAVLGVPITFLFVKIFAFGKR